MKSGRTKAVAPTSTLLWGWEGNSVRGRGAGMAQQQLPAQLRCSCTRGRLSITLLPGPGNRRLRAPTPALEPWQGGWCPCQLLEVLGSQGADVVYWGCTEQTPPCCRCRLAMLLGAGAAWGAGNSFPVRSPSPSHWGEHQPQPLLISPPGPPEEGPRVVFMVDLWHPNVAAAERQALDFIFAPGR